MDIVSSDPRAEGPSDKFEYEPLRSDNEIRLLKLRPAGFYDSITCTLTHAPLDSAKRSYEALSYTWGSTEDRVLIQVNEKPLRVTHNLATALRYLRENHYRQTFKKRHRREKTHERVDRDMTLWIDAICINQEDIEEKKDQVALMTKIYQDATQVISWLGPAARDSERIMSLFNSVGKKAQSGGKLFDKQVRQHPTEKDQNRLRRSLFKRHSWSITSEKVTGFFKDGGKAPRERKPEESMDPKGLRQHLMDKSQSRLRRALEALLERDYWTRAWIVQEVLMADKITLMCGLDSASWECADDIVTIFIEERIRLIDITSFSSMDSSSSSDHHSIVSPPTYESRMCFQTFKQLHFSRLISENQKGPDWMLKMLMALRHFKAKDPRDKIFSLLGLINRDLFQNRHSTTTPLQVDYGLSFRSVSTKMLQYYLSAFPCKGSLNITCASQSPRSDGFPSWLPDFSKDNGMEPWPVLGYQHCEFEGDAPYFSSDDTILHVSAVRVTTISQGYVTGEDDDCFTIDNSCLLGRIWAFMQLSAKEGSFNSLFWKSRNHTTLLSNAQDILGATPMAEYINLPLFPDSFSPTRILEELESGMKHRKNGVPGFLDTFRRKSFRRRFAIFKIEGVCYPSLVPAAARPGDGLYLLRGCEIPVLLRSKENEQSAYEFIGACCILGWVTNIHASSYGPIETIELY